MEAQLADKQRGWAVTTRDGTFFVPGEVVVVPLCLAQDVPIYAQDPGAVAAKWCTRYDAEIVEVLQRRPAAFIESIHPITEIQVIYGYFYRLSAPGYLDATGWDFALTKGEAKRALRELVDG